MTEENQTGAWDSLLTEEAQDGEEYIQPTFGCVFRNSKFSFHVWVLNLDVNTKYFN